MCSFCVLIYLISTFASGYGIIALEVLHMKLEELLYYLKENLLILSIIYFAGVLVGILVDLII